MSVVPRTANPSSHISKACDDTQSQMQFHSANCESEKNFAASNSNRRYRFATPPGRRLVSHQWQTPQTDLRPSPHFSRLKLALPSAYWSMMTLTPHLAVLCRMCSCASTVPLVDINVRTCATSGNSGAIPVSAGTDPFTIKSTTGAFHASKRFQTMPVHLGLVSQQRIGTKTSTPYSFCPLR